jgi:hypothetical protein
MKIWVDAIRRAPDITYLVCKGVNETINAIVDFERVYGTKENPKFLEPVGHLDIALLDLDYDAGDCAKDGGDYIKILEWLEETNRNYPIRIHSQNPVGVENMRRIIERNGWTEVK